MNMNILLRDIMRNKVIYCILLFFISIATFLVIASIYIVIQVGKSVDQLYEVANPPHFIQLHKGELDRNKIEDFVKNNLELKDYQIVNMINIDGGDITFQKKTGEEIFDLRESVLDNGFVYQNIKFDLLLDTDNIIIDLKPGEIGIPLIYTDTYEIEIGDYVFIGNGSNQKKFIVSTFVRDAQMNSTMCSSTRFLIHQSDFAELINQIGEIEYEIEFLLYDKNKAAEFQALYEEKQLPSNGQPITYQIMKLLSCFSFYMLSIMIGIVGILVVFISSLSLRFTIKASLEEEIRDVGILRAIGLNKNHVKKIFLIKYRILTIVGCFIGFLCFFISKNLWIVKIQRTFGITKDSLHVFLLAFLGTMCVYLVILITSRIVIKKAIGISIWEAMKNEKGSEKSKRWLLIGIVMFIATIITLLPLHIYNTVKDSRFITYMGADPSDITLRIQTAEDIVLKRDQIEEAIQTMYPRINSENYYEYKVYTYGENQEVKQFRLKAGNYNNSKLQYLEGRNPISNYEIALSYFNALLYKKEIGDIFYILLDQEIYEFIVSGIYQDVTDGGYTAKTNNEAGIFSDNHLSVLEYRIFLSEEENKIEIIKQLEKLMPEGTKIMDSEDYIKKTMSSFYQIVISAMKIIWFISILLVTFLSFLYCKLKIIQHHSQIAIKKAIGFSVSSIKKEYRKQIGSTIIIASLTGAVIVGLCGDKVLSLLLNISGMGIKMMGLLPDISQSFIVLFSLIIAALLSIELVLYKIKDVHIMNIKNE